MGIDFMSGWIQPNRLNLDFSEVNNFDGALCARVQSAVVLQLLVT